MTNLKLKLVFIPYLLAALIWIGLSTLPDKSLHIVSCNVGQGDATLIWQDSTQLLIDGGPDKSVTECLGKYMPFWDREIEMVILTHPDADHATGLIDVFRSYSVKSFVEHPSKVGTDIYRVLEETVQSSQAQKLDVVRGMRLGWGLIYLDILNPVGKDNTILANNAQIGVEQDISGLVDKTPVPIPADTDTNNNSVVVNLRMGKFSALFTGDAGYKLLENIAENYLIGESQSVDYIKVSHHGSKTGTSLKLLNLINPRVATISVGEKNRYGHPAAEVIKMLDDKDVMTLRTDKVGDIEVITDGNKWWLATN